jgi:DNA-binding Lrp family transcriptional regulator
VCVSLEVIVMRKQDWLMLSFLRQNGRVRLTQIARKTGAPVSTIFDRLRNHPAIAKHTALLNYERLGFGTRAHLILKAKNKTAMIDHLRKHPLVNNLYVINNGWDAMVEGVFRDMKSLEEFVDELDVKFGLKAKEVHYIIEELLREAFLADPQLIDFIAE